MHLYPEYRHLQTKTIAEIGKEGLSTEDTLHTTAVEVIANNGQTDNSEAGSQGESEQPDRRERGGVMGRMGRSIRRVLRQLVVSCFQKSVVHAYTEWTGNLSLGGI